MLWVAFRVWFFGKDGVFIDRMSALEFMVPAKGISKTIIEFRK